MGFYIEMIGVGEGDSFLLTLDNPDGEERHVLIDGGDGEKSYRVVDHVNKYANGFLSLIVGTHLDDDHLGGLIDVIESGIKVNTLILNTPGSFQKWLQMREVFKSFTKVESMKKLEKSVQTTNDLLEVAKARAIHVENALAGRFWTCGKVRLNVLNPTAERLENCWAEKILTDISTLSKSTWQKYLVEKGEAAAPTTPGNDASIIIELVYDGNPYALLTSDVGADVIREVTANKSYEFLKVPHHGSKTGLDEDLIKQLSPTVAHIPVGENSYGHPCIEILQMLRKHGATTYCSEKTKDCRKECKAHDFIVVCHKKDKPGRPDFSRIEPTDCKNNVDKVV